MHSEQEIEADIKRAGKTAPRITSAIIDARIVGAYFHRVPDTALTICVLTLDNGFTVTGESAAASPENYDAEIGMKIAKQNAREKIWALEGYLLKSILSGRAIAAGDYDVIQR